MIAKVLNILEEEGQIQIAHTNGKQYIPLYCLNIEVDEGLIYFEQAIGTNIDINAYFDDLQKVVSETLNTYEVKHKWLKNGALKILAI